MTWDELDAHTLVVYETTWCGDCRRLHAELDRHAVSYGKIDIDADPKAAKSLQARTGRTAIPYVEVDGKRMIRGWHEESPVRWDGETFLQEVEKGLGEA